jgi:hypothetical protein
VTPFLGDSSSLTRTRFDNRIASRILKADQGLRGVLADVPHTSHAEKRSDFIH